VPPISTAYLLDAYCRGFQLMAAVDPVLQDAAYRLRHSVYAEDLGWEPLRADGREIDQFDAQAIHLLVRHLPSDEFVGCVRLIRVSAVQPSDPLPFEHVCSGLSTGAVPASPAARVSIAEVSRLAIGRKFRRRRGEEGRPAPLSAPDFSGGPILRFPYILAALYLGVIAAADMHGIHRLFVLTEPRLAQHLDRLGVRMLQIGAPVEHRGERIPSMIDVPSALASLGPLMRPLYDHILEGLALQYAQVASAGSGALDAGRI
jgi:N-acyl amino acid synthase of PEP-CTERM/exosortase system